MKKLIVALAVIASANTYANEGWTITGMAEEREVHRTTWTTKSETDPMTGVTSHYAHSKAVRPIKSMAFPYEDVESWLGVACNEKETWAYLGFTQSPNLSGGDLDYGRTNISPRIKWSNGLQRMKLFQPHGGKFIHFYDAKTLATKAKATNQMVVELNWYGNGAVHFSYDMKGSSKAINEVLNKCK